MDAIANPRNVAAKPIPNGAFTGRAFADTFNAVALFESANASRTVFGLGDSWLGGGEKRAILPACSMSEINEDSVARKVSA